MNIKKPYLIAEIGINHNGSLKNAFKLIDLAKKYNFDCVKFQKRTPEITTPSNQADVKKETPWGVMSYLQYKKKIEFGRKEYDAISSYCKKIKIDWTASAWDLESLKFLSKYRVKFHKVASAMLTNLDFLENVAKKKKLTLISTGMSTMTDINKAVKIFKKYKCAIVIMHCVSHYPCPQDKINLNLINLYKKKFKNVLIGYSGHESNVFPSVVAWLMGAEYIERHITLDRSMWGTDQSASLSEPGIESLTKLINLTPQWFGRMKKIKSKEDHKLQKKFKYW